MPNSPSTTRSSGRRSPRPGAKLSNTPGTGSWRCSPTRSPPSAQPSSVSVGLAGRVTLRSRIGLHTAPAAPTADDYFGPGPESRRPGHGRGARRAGVDVGVDGGTRARPPADRARGGRPRRTATPGPRSTVAHLGGTRRRSRRRRGAGVGDRADLAEPRSCRRARGRAGDVAVGGRRGAWRPPERSCCWLARRASARPGWPTRRRTAPGRPGWGCCAAKPTRRSASRWSCGAGCTGRSASIRPTIRRSRPPTGGGSTSTRWPERCARRRRRSWSSTTSTGRMRRRSGCSSSCRERSATRRWRSSRPAATASRTCPDSTALRRVCRVVRLEGLDADAVHQLAAAQASRPIDAVALHGPHRRQPTVRT